MVNENIKTKDALEEFYQVTRKVEANIMRKCYSLRV